MKERVNGVVKWFDDKKGYGFIIHEGADYFVRWHFIKKTGGRRTLHSGASVSFIPSHNSQGGLVALDVEETNEREV